MLGDKGAAPTSTHLALSKPIAFFTLSYTTFWAIPNPKGAF